MYVHLEMNPSYLGEMPCFGSERILLLFKRVSFDNLLPKKKETESKVRAVSSKIVLRNNSLTHRRFQVFVQLRRAVSDCVR